MSVHFCDFHTVVLCLCLSIIDGGKLCWRKVKRIHFENVINFHFLLCHLVKKGEKYCYYYCVWLGTHASFLGPQQHLSNYLLQNHQLFVYNFQVQQGGGGSAVKYSGPWDVAKSLYREGGMRSIFKGTVATLLRGKNRLDV